MLPIFNNATHSNLIRSNFVKAYEYFHWIVVAVLYFVLVYVMCDLLRRNNGEFEELDHKFLIFALCWVALLAINCSCRLKSSLIVQLSAMFLTFLAFIMISSSPRKGVYNPLLLLREQFYTIFTHGAFLGVLFSLPVAVVHILRYRIFNRSNKDSLKE